MFMHCHAATIALSKPFIARRRVTTNVSPTVTKSILIAWRFVVCCAVQYVCSVPRTVASSRFSKSSLPELVLAHRSIPFTRQKPNPSLPPIYQVFIANFTQNPKITILPKSRKMAIFAKKTDFSKPYRVFCLLWNFNPYTKRSTLPTYHPVAGDSGREALFTNRIEDHDQIANSINSASNPSFHIATRTS